jgi:hypothetical protein
MVEENVGNMKRSGGAVKKGAKLLTWLFMFVQLALSSKVSPGPRKMTSNGRSQSSLPSHSCNIGNNCFGVAPFVHLLIVLTLCGIVIRARG